MYRHQRRKEMSLQVSEWEDIFIENYDMNLKRTCMDTVLAGLYCNLQSSQEYLYSAFHNIDCIKQRHSINQKIITMFVS